jgi:CRP-like cAMP-binding protein
MANPFISKMEHGAELTDEDRAALEKAVGDVRQIGANKDLIKEGDKPEHVHLILEGFAFRYKLLADGQRQIMAYLVPGDLCDLHVSILGEMDHSLGTLSPCKVGYIARKTVDELTERHPRINRALWWATLVDEGTLREWLVSMGRREAEQQMAHILCELLVRLQTVGLATENSYEFPITQEELGDTLGLSTVHVNRVLRRLRDDGLITLSEKRLTIHDVERLKAFADFDPNYLHLKQRPSREQPEVRVAAPA